MNSQRIIKLLSLLVFLSCSGTAFSLALLTFNFVTGDLPFGLTPILETKLEKRSEPEVSDDHKVQKKGPIMAERYITSLYNQLEKKEKELNAKEKKLEELATLKDNADDTADEVQSKLTAKTEELQDLIDVIDETEKKNAEQVAEVFASMNISDAADSMMKMSVKRAARVCRAMTSETVADIISELKQKENAEGEKKASELLNALFTKFEKETEAVND